MPSPRRRLGRFALPALAAGALILPGTAAAAPACSTGQPPASETLCWLNAARAQRDVAAVRRDARLERAALLHSQDMVSHGYFEHTGPRGPDFVARIAATGWMRNRPEWRVGETLAWGSGSLAEPSAIVQAWMSSPPHRRIVLSPRFRLVGIGIAAGTPTGVPDGETVTADFGS